MGRERRRSVLVAIVERLLVSVSDTVLVLYGIVGTTLMLNLDG